jgi:hypothetical protein
MKQTAVLFLYEFVQLKLTDEQQAQFEGLFQQAFDMEKEQIKRAYYAGDNDVMDNPYREAEQYYNETFKSE